MKRLPRTVAQHETQSIVVSFPASAANRISCRIGFKTEEQTALCAFMEPNSLLASVSRSKENTTIKRA